MTDKSNSNEAKLLDLCGELDDFFTNKADELPDWCIDYIDMWLKKARNVNKIKATLTLTVVYDTHGDDTFDSDATLRSLVEYASSQGLLTDDNKEVVVDTMNVDIKVEEL